MSTRYVWDKYDIKNILGYGPATSYHDLSPTFSDGSSYANGPSDSVSYTMTGYFTKNVVVNDDGTVTLSGLSSATSTVNSVTSNHIDANTTGVGAYIIFAKQGASIADPITVNINNVYCFSDSQCWAGISYNGYGMYTINCYMSRAEKKQSKGTLQGYASSASSGTYPTDGVSGSYWYTYQGSDTIDPALVEYVSSPQGGQPITLTVTPGTGKVYGGTVSYLYQVKLGDGEWTTIATTSATSYQYTIPYGTTTFQARVRAQDNLGFTSSDYVTGTQVTVINNQPPTAPGSIAVSNVVSGQVCTITLTAATDPDGTIASYIYERSVDGSAWQQIANVNALTYQDTVSGDWGTVAYRACAVDDDGESGPYVTGSTTTVNSGWVIISGPANNMGDKPAPFNFVFSVSVTGQSSVDAISVTATLDGESLYTGTPNSGVEVSIPIDTRLLAAGAHTVEVQATKENYVEASGSYAFNVPAITLPAGGRAEMLQNPEGEAVFPYTLARLVIGKGGKDVNALLEEAMSTVTDLSGEVLEVKAGALKMATGTYTGTGTYGSSNPNTLTFGFAPKFVLIEKTGYATDYTNRPTMFLAGETGSGVGIYNSFGVMLTWSNNGKTVTWYNPDSSTFPSYPSTAQLNESGVTYGWVAIGQ